MIIIDQLHVECFIACVIGNIVHLAALVNSRYKDQKAANMEFSLWEFLKTERYALLFDLLGSLGLVYAADEIADSPYILGKIKLVFIMIGIGGSYLIMQIFGRSKKIIRDVVDKKTNIADNKTEDK